MDGNEIKNPPEVEVEEKAPNEELTGKINQLIEDNNKLREEYKELFNKLTKVTIQPDKNQEPQTPPNPVEELDGITSPMKYVDKLEELNKEQNVAYICKVLNSVLKPHIDNFIELTPDNYDSLISKYSKKIIEEE